MATCRSWQRGRSHRQCQSLPPNWHTANGRAARARTRTPIGAFVWQAIRSPARARTSRTAMFLGLDATRLDMTLAGHGGPRNSFVWNVNTDSRHGSVRPVGSVAAKFVVKPRVNFDVNLSLSALASLAVAKCSARSSLSSSSSSSSSSSCFLVCSRTNIIFFFAVFDNCNNNN